jgi:N-methylhydantoinase B/oxoprolinase/acetone carboxylase alpha subunit
MGLPEFAQISEENELLRDQLREREDEVDEPYAEINELKAQLNAKEEGATTHRELAQHDGAIWSRDVTVIAPEWERVREV